MREEQPMPDTTATCSGGSASFASALVTAESTEKSPHPGHHTGLTSDLYDCGVKATAATAVMSGSRR